MPRVSSKDKYTVQVFELFKRYGLSLNMEQIAQELGLTKKTLYNNFTSKQELIGTVVSYFYSTLEREMTLAIDDSENAIHAMFNVSRVIADEISKLGETLLKDMSLYHACDEIFAFTSRSNFYSKFMVDNLKRGIAEGLFRPTLDMEYTSIFYNSAIERFYRWDGEFKYFSKAVKFHNELVKHHLYSVVNDKGRILLENYM
jgi:AcrR family transcriptional regulator